MVGFDNGGERARTTPARADVLYVSNGGNGVIEKFTGGGDSFFASSSTGGLGLACDTAGNLYAANNFNNTIEKFTPGGGASIFANFSDGLNGLQFLAFTDDAGVPLKLAKQVPEPGTLALLGLSALLFAARRRGA